jgi:hypothetical protein
MLLDICDLTEIVGVRHTSPSVAAQIPPVKAPLTAALALTSCRRVGAVLEQMQSAVPRPLANVMAAGK